MDYIMQGYDVAVIGAGHAGCEAALACARLGVKTVLFTLSLDTIANMPCNPSIGGTAKGHLVREIDALGGQMGKVADETFLQSRMLNRGKGPAVHSLRVQSDRAQYHQRMKEVLEAQEGLEIRQAEVVDILLDEEGVLCGVKTKLGAVFPVKAAVMASGTYQNALIHVGNVSYPAGPDASLASVGLTERLAALGMPIRRFKTGTPARVHRRSIDFTKLEPQAGDEQITPFSFTTEGELKNRVLCYMAYTNEKTHEVIRQNLHRSPLYGEEHRIEGVGPRYCPSIEDKIVRFPDKERHQLFVEPMGLDTEECYLQGMSSSLPEDVQLAFLRTIEGFEHIEIMRSAYAIEYDCCDPQQLRPTLESKQIPGFYGAGQFNGTSGYEEAAAQGLVAGINAAHRVLGKEPVTLERSGSYIGTLIDDLVVKGCSDPYRMMTSRSEYRLLLRQDNADRRLTPLGYKLGLISEERYKAFCEKVAGVDKEIERIKHCSIPYSEALNQMLEQKGTAPVKQGLKAAELLRRPQISYRDLAPFDPDRPALTLAQQEQVEIEIKYEGYIRKQTAQVHQMQKWEQKSLPQGIDYKTISGLRLEAQEKLNRVRPTSIGQASRISGVNPADISVLLIWLEQQKAAGKEDLA